LTIVAVHNWYQTRGGEDRVFEAECALLEAHGHRVVRYTADNASIARMSRLRLLKATLWNAAAYRELRLLVQRERAEVVHFHNTFPLLSASVLRAAKMAGGRVIQTLHNFRLICPSGLMLRAGGPCELCVGRALPWPGVRYGCYRHSRAATLLAAAAVLVGKQAACFDGVDAYIAVSEFARKLFLRGGLRAERLTVKPNFAELDAGPGEGGGGYVLYLGRLSEEKGLHVLLEAWNLLGSGRILRIAGTGPLAGWVAREIHGRNVQYCGPVSRQQALQLLREAALLVVPSLCYEGCPLVVVEAFASGTPVVASNLGGLAELVTPAQTGWLVPAGDPEALATVLEQALGNTVRLRAMRKMARRQYEQHYTAEANYRMLMDIYRRAVES